jgi:hypothetical protein
MNSVFLLLLVFSVELISAMNIYKKTRAQECRFEPKCSTGILFLPDEDCAKYWKCDGNLACIIECDPGDHWSPSHNVCLPSAMAGCENGESTTMTNRPTSSTQPPVNACKMDSRCPVLGDPQHPTHLPHEYDCGKFYKCLGRMACPMSCPAGLHFSVKRDRCDYQHAAECSTSMFGQL